MNLKGAFRRKDEDEFVFNANSILHWQASAHKLAYAAMILFKQYEKVWCTPLKENREPLDPDWFYSSLIPVIVLCGSAIENLIKGILIAKGTPAVVGDELNPTLGGHNLRELIDLAKFSVQKREKRLLARLEQAIRFGKYPIPKAVSGVSNHRKARSLLEEDVKVIRRLFNRLDNELRLSAPGETDPTMESVLKRTESTTNS